MPWSSHPIPRLEPCYPLANCGDVTDNLMTGDNRPAVRQVACLLERICVANTARQNLDKDLSRAGGLEGKILKY